jgi:hypothetical protein
VGYFHKVSDILRKYFSVVFHLTLSSAYFGHVIVGATYKEAASYAALPAPFY